MEQKATVATPAPAIACLEQKRALPRAIMAGSEAMRNPTYLPKYPAEGQADYEARCERTFLDNFVGKAIDSATGKLFAKEIKTDNLPAEIETLCENIDRQGRALSPFIMDVAKLAFQDGISYVMADMPPRPGNVVSQADEKQAGLRPYAIHVKPCCVLEVLSEMVGGVETLTRVRIMECVQEAIPGEWGYTDIEQVRVWHRGQTETGALVRWETYRQNEKNEWVLFESAPTTFKAIYLVPFYTNRTGFMLGAPPFADIAESTLEHFQLKSDYQAALEMCNFGMYWATGVPEEFKMKVGPRQSLVSSSTDAKFGVMETTGAAVTLSLDAIKAVEARIESAGVDLRVENAGQVTATAATLDSEETNAALKAIAEGFSDSIEQLFGYFGEMMGIDASQAEAEVNEDFGVRHGTGIGLQEIGKYRAMGDISREGVLDILRWRGEIPPTFDAAADDERISSEGPALGMIPGKKTQDQQQMPDQMQQDMTAA
ncbi:MAG: DUF4055 domain-containing protein [Acidithiobacillus sp.]|nr:DUF4055 domain-containing protein [Acidithiobacillus sp.]